MLPLITMTAPLVAASIAARKAASVATVAAGAALVAKRRATGQRSEVKSFMRLIGATATLHQAGAVCQWRKGSANVDLQMSKDPPEGFHKRHKRKPCRQGKRRE